MLEKPNSQRWPLVIVAVAVACIVVFSVVELMLPEPATVDGPRLVNALAQYARDLRIRGAPIPPTVTLDTLLRLGYVTPADVKPFRGAKVTFYADADSSRPQSILVQADKPDGTVEAILADGSVQQFSKQMWQEVLKAREQGGPTGVGLQVGARTNRMGAGGVTTP